MTTDQLLPLLQGVKKAGTGYVALCPAHDDRNPSLSINAGRDGGVVIYCHAGCTSEAVVGALGHSITDLRASDTYRTTTPRPATLARSATVRASAPPLHNDQVIDWNASLGEDPEAWTYVTGTLGFSPQVIERNAIGYVASYKGRRWIAYPYRRGGEWTFAKLRSMDGEKAFERLPAGQASHLYGFDALEDGGIAIVTEGERDAIAAQAMNLPAELGCAVVSLPNGAKGVGGGILEPLRRQRRVIVLTDADAEGDKAADAITATLGADRCVRVRLDGFKDLGDLLASAGADEGRRVAVAAIKAAEETQDQDVKPDPLPTALRSGGQLLDATFPPLRFAVEPYFPRGELIEVTGAHGIYKSTTMLSACLCVATGRTWGGAPTATGKAVFITMEDSEPTLQTRIRSWLDSVPAGKEREEAARMVRGQFEYLSREHAQGLALTATDKAGTTMRMEVVERVASLVTGAVLVVMETASRLHDGPETNEALSAFAHALERIGTTSEAAVAIVRHTSKDGARKQITDSYAGRGGVALSDAARSICVMTRERPPKKDKGETDNDEAAADPFAPIRFTHVKANLTDLGPRITFQPVLSTNGRSVHLEVVTMDEETDRDASFILDHLRRRGSEGITHRTLHLDNVRDGEFRLGRAKALRAIEALLKTGKATKASEPRKGQQAIVYRAATSAT